MNFHVSEVFFRIIIITFLVFSLLEVKKITKISDNIGFKYYVISLWLLLSQHSLMFLIRFGEVYFGIKPPEPYFPIFDHTIETLFFIYFLFASLSINLLALSKNIIRFSLHVSIIAFIIITVIISLSYIRSYELGMEFGNHWGDLIFEAWHLLIIEALVFLFAFLYLARKDNKTVLFLIAMTPWLIGHTGHLLNLAIADNNFIPLRWIEWPFFAVGTIILFFAFRKLSLSLRGLEKEHG